MEELKRLRKARGLSQAKLAALADLDPSTVSQIETGARRANTRTLERLAAALGAEVADLFPKAQAPLPLEERGAISEPRARPAADAHLTVRGWEDLEENLTTEQVREILEGVRDGRTTVEAAVHRLEKAGQRPA